MPIYLGLKADNKQHYIRKKGWKGYRLSGKQVWIWVQSLLGIQKIVRLSSSSSFSFSKHPLAVAKPESCKIYYYMMSQNKLIRRDDHNTQSVTKSTMISRADQLVRIRSQLFYVTSVIWSSKDQKPIYNRHTSPNILMTIATLLCHVCHLILQRSDLGSAAVAVARKSADPSSGRACETTTDAPIIIEGIGSSDTSSSPWLHLSIYL